MESDDYLHNPDPRRDRKLDRGLYLFTYRGLTNIGCLVILCVGLLALLCVPKLFAISPLTDFIPKVLAIPLFLISRARLNQR